MNILYGEQFNINNIHSWSVHCYEVVNNLSEMGHNVVLLGGKTFIPGSVSKSDGQSQRPSLWTRLEEWLSRFRMIQLFRGELSLLKNILEDLWVFLLTFITIIRYRGRLNVIYRRHNLLISQYLLASIFRIRLVTELNAIIVDEVRLRKHGDRYSLWVIDKIERFNIPKADKIIVVTSRLKDLLQEDYGVPADKIVMIPNGANIDLFKPMDVIKAREELGLVPSNNYVGFVGILWQVQHVDNLIRSVPLIVKELPNTKFLIVGDGVTRQDLVSLTEQLGVADKVVFTGMVPYPKVPLYMNASDVCVIPAANNFRNTKTGASSLKLYEYLACGKPVVAGNIDGNNQDIINSGSGFVVNSMNPDEMARAIVTLLQNELLRKEMGERGRKLAEEKHSWKKISELVAEVCQSVVTR